MSENFLLEVMDSLRSSVRTHDAVLVSLQIAAWVHLSLQGKLPSKLSLDVSNKPRGGTELARIFHDLSQETGIGDVSRAFEFLEGVVRQIDDVGLARTLEQCETLSRSGLIDGDLVKDAIQAMRDVDRTFHCLPDEVSDLLVALAKISAEAQVYCPFDEALQLSCRVSTLKASAFAEVIQSSPLPWLVKVLTSSKVEISTSDPIRQPFYVGGGQMRKFDAAITFPPMGWRREFEITAKDLFSRFPEKTTSGTVLSVRHALAQSKGRVVIAVPNSLLFSTGAEKSLRASLIDNRQVESVISLPPALLSSTTIPFSILVLRNDKKSELVRFVDAAVGEFHIKDGRGRSELLYWKELIAVVESREDTKNAKSVKIEEIEQSDYSFLPSRYCLTEESSEFDSILASRDTKSLEELVEFHRPTPPSKKSGTQALEIVVSDIPEFGFVRPPTKEVVVSEVGIHAERQFIKPFDLLIVVKGSAGKVGLVPAAVPSGGELRWVCGQSCLVLRMRPGSPMTPVALFGYLTSKMGRGLLKRLVTGATIPLIQLTELRRLPIIQLTDLEIRNAESAFQRQIELQELIDNACHEQAALAENIWAQSSL